AENNFPLPDITVVGVDLMLVERVIGKLSWRRVVSAGVGTGAWLGFIAGLLLSLVNGQAGSFAPIAVGVGGGIVFGLIFASVGYASSRGRRDFQSASQLVAGRYDVLCQQRTAEKARDLIAKFSMRPQANPS
ncbi:MAG TPA: general stress protein, partial [Pseudonocardiaceae bacterium]